MRLEGDAGREGLAKLGGLAGEGADTALAELDVTPRPGGAVRRGQPAGHGDVLVPRRACATSIPTASCSRFGHWYVVGHDRDRDAPRAFRVDRIDGEPELGPDGGFAPPDAASIPPTTSAPTRSPTARTSPSTRTCWSTPHAPAGWSTSSARRRWWSAGPTARSSSRLPVVNRAAFRSWVVDLLDHAEVLSPPELRADMVAWLDAVAGVARAPSARRDGERVSRPLVGPRLQRVLALVPWILAHPGGTIAELAARFEVSERELERDLELLPMCGLPPYTADRLIDVSVIDGEVEIRLAEYFERPLRLTPAEGLALLAAGRALLAVPGSDDDGPLATALAKLDDALGAPGSLAVDVGASDQLAATAGRGSRRRARRDRLLLVRARRDDHPRHRPVAGVPRVRRLVRGRVVPPRARTSDCSASTACGRCARPGSTSTRRHAPTTTSRDLVYRPAPRIPA